MEGKHFQLYERTFLSCHYCSNYELKKIKMLQSLYQQAFQECRFMCNLNKPDLITQTYLQNRDRNHPIMKFIISLNACVARISLKKNELNHLEYS
jgi:hypothetical protein